MKTYGSIAPRILNFGTRWRWVVSFTPQSLYPRGKSPPYALDTRLGRPQSRCGRCGEGTGPIIAPADNWTSVD